MPKDQIPPIQNRIMGSRFAETLSMLLSWAGFGLLIIKCAILIIFD